MRKVFALVLVVLASMQAQAASSFGSISGRAIDAVGRAVASQRVELMRDGQVVTVAMTDTRGAWTFANVDVGDYIVRTSIKGTLAGARVTVRAGESVAGTLIVVPTAAVSPQFGALASLATSLAAATGSVAVQTAVAAVVETEATNLDAEAVAEIINALPPAQKQVFAQAVLSVIQENPTSGNVFATVTETATGQVVSNTNFTQVIQQVIANPSAPVTISAS